MTSPVTAVLNTLQDALDLLTGEIETADCALDPGVCHTALYAGPSENVPYETFGESCSDGDGQLWASLTSLDVTVQEGGSCSRVVWLAVVGIVRCAANIPDGDYRPPVPAITRDALQQASDADALWRALSCCPDRPETLQDISLVTWTPVTEGGVTGGFWTVSGVLDDCCDAPPVYPRERYC